MYLVTNSMWFLKMSFPPPSSTLHGGSSKSFASFPTAITQNVGICWIRFEPFYAFQLRVHCRAVDRAASIGRNDEYWSSNGGETHP